MQANPTQLVCNPVALPPVQRKQTAAGKNGSNSLQSSFL
jgi:hypothetical protein